MRDRIDLVARTLIGLGVAGALAAALVVRPAGLPDTARAAWLRIADRQAAGRHEAAHTFAIDVAGAGEDPRPYDGRPFPVRRGQEVRIGGWAFDPATLRTAAGMAVALDRGPWRPVEYHRDRPDVASTLGLPMVADSGFRIVIPTERLGPGTHVAHLATVAADGRQSTIPATVAFRLSAR